MEEDVYFIAQIIVVGSGSLSQTLLLHQMVCFTEQSEQAPP